MIDLAQYGYMKTELPEGSLPARITAVHRGMYEAVCPQGNVKAELKMASYYHGDIEAPAVGDFVTLLHNPYGNSLITATHPRRSKFSRSDFSGHSVGFVKTVLEQVLAANFDYVFIMASLNYDFNLKRLERYLVLAWQSGAVPVLVLNKADLVEDYSKQLAGADSIAPGVESIPVSAKTGIGLDRLRPYVAPGKTVVFLGSSGVGKSSLVNALAGEELMDTGGIREDDSKGRHTTTHRQLIMLPSGAMVIDTPGMRELGMYDADEGIAGAFSDVEELFLRCKYSDCTHQSEPGCAVQTALEDGSLHPNRWRNYQELLRETRFADRKAANMQHKEHRSKEIAVHARQIKKQRNVLERIERDYE